jgi:hypothetical protein
MEIISVHTIPTFVTPLSAWHWCGKHSGIVFVVPARQPICPGDVLVHEAKTYHVKSVKCNPVPWQFEEKTWEVTAETIV